MPADRLGPDRPRRRPPAWEAGTVTISPSRSDDPGALLLEGSSMASIEEFIREITGRRAAG
jgi:hypothetical protein